MRFGKCLLSDSFLVESQENTWGKITVWINIWFTSAPSPPPKPMNCWPKRCTWPDHRLGCPQWFWPISKLLEVTTACVWCAEFPAPPTTTQTLSKFYNLTGLVANAELGREGWTCGDVARRMIWQEMTAYQPPPTPRGLGSQREPAGERKKSSLITEQCQSAVGEDDEIIKHFPRVFFIRPVLFFFQVLGKQNRSPASSSTTAAPSPGNSSCANRRGALRGTGPNTFLMEIMICKALFIPFAT